MSAKRGVKFATGSSKYRRLHCAVRPIAFPKGVDRCAPGTIPSPRAASVLGEEMAVGQVDQTPALGERQLQQRGGLLDLVLMKGFELTHGGRRVSLPLSAQRLVALLALNERPLPRLYVAGTLWIDSTEEHSNGSLRSALWRLHRPG